MKVLTIEQKAKVYDEAIKRAEAVIKVAQNQKEVYGCITTIFPELKELEEEQIMEDAVRATIDFPLIGHDFPNIYPNYRELKEYCIRHGINDNDKVRITIVKDNRL